MYFGYARLLTLTRRAAKPIAAAAIAFSLCGHGASPALSEDGQRPAVDVSSEASGVAHEDALDTEAAAATLVDLINWLRAEYGVPPLEVDQALTDLAFERSADMARRRYFSHDIPGVGYAPQWLLRQLPHARGVGENLGMSSEPNAIVVDVLFGMWAASPGHAENMLRAEFSHVGVSLVEIAERRRGHSVKVATQVFAIASGPLHRA